MTGVENSPDEQGEPDEGWRKLDPRTVRITALNALGVAVVAGVPTGIGISNSSVGLALAIVLPVAAVGIVGAVVIDRLRWHKTSYRVLADRVELRSGILVRKRRTLARDRIRTVDLTAGLLQRYFRVTHVKIGTGEQTESGASSLGLNPVPAAVGERLRTELLSRSATASGRSADDSVLAVLDPRWVRFAPMSFLTPTLGAAAFGAVFQVAEWFGVQEGVVPWVLDLLRGLSIVGIVAVLVVVGLVVGAVASLALFVELWWNYRLEREPGTLRVRRGLLTTRSLSLEEQRLRGVELIEPLGVRAVGAARVDAVATGLSREKEDEKTDRKTLLPAAPKDVADRVAAAVLAEPVSPTEAARIAGHPRAARARRVRWALLAAAVPVVAMAVLGLVFGAVFWHLAWICAVVLVPVAVALAFEAYRNLGHGLTGGYLVARSGVGARRTVALRRKGIVGWTAKQSVFQRRQGLITLTATTAAGHGGYSVVDVGEAEGLRFAQSAVPHLLTPFLEPATPEPAAARS